MTNSSVSAVDLTNQIIDTDARLNARKTLYGRLNKLLQTQDAKLNDLINLEQEMSRVQANIDSDTSLLAAYRLRVNMSDVDISYVTKSIGVNRNAMTPAVNALTGFVRTFAQGLGNVITFIAALLPWMIVIVPGLWLIRRFWRGRKIGLGAGKVKKSKAVNN